MIIHFSVRFAAVLQPLCNHFATMVLIPIKISTND